MNKVILTIILALAACSPMIYTRGVPNLAQVDENIYRSGQITTTEGWDTISQLAAGRTVHVVKLNFEHEGTDSQMPDGFWLNYLPIQPEGDQDWWDDLASVFRHPDEASVQSAVEALDFCLENLSTDFCLVHCTHGQDRTGYVVGRHRVTNEGWTKDEAYHEMRQHNFHPELHGVYDAWQDWQP